MRWSEADLASLPVTNGFRLRGIPMTRTETFTDAAFAFAVTMLVISVDDVPSTYREFVDALKSTPAFLASFLQLIMFWFGHRTWSRFYGLDDGRAVWLSVALIAGVLVIVYPLRVIFSSAFSYMTDGVLPGSFDVTLEQMATIFAVYGIGFSVLCGLIALLFLHAFNRRGPLALNAVEVFETVSYLQAWCLLSGFGMCGFLLAVTLDGEAVVLAGWIYALLGIAMPVHDRWRARRWRVLANRAVGVDNDQTTTGERTGERDTD